MSRRIFWIALMAGVTLLFVAAPRSWAQAPERPPGKDNNNPGKESNKEPKKLYTDLVVEVEASGTADKISGAEVLVKSEQPGGGYDSRQKTNGRGAARLQHVPQGRVRVQVIARDYETFGDFYTLTSDQQTIKVALKKMQQ